MNLFYASEVEFQRIYERLKSTPCPNCKCYGTLNLHGKLYGYSGDSNTKVVRGRRIFCSNRRRHKNGCGHTFVVWHEDQRKFASLGATDFWTFLKSIINGSTKINALRQMKIELHTSAAYRLWKRFCLKQSEIRTCLSCFGEPPPMPLTTESAFQTIAHIAIAFKNHTCPLVAFQKHFKRFV